MNEKMLLLRSSLESGLRLLAEICSELPAVPLPPDASQRDLIFVAYHLHAVYGVMENQLKNIAESFENSIDDRSRWHAQLLERMCLDLTPLRPAVIDDATRDKLAELRRFRHLFRSAYGIRFDRERLSFVLRTALEIQEPFRRQVEGFIRFLGGLDALAHAGPES